MDSDVDYVLMQDSLVPESDSKKEYVKKDDRPILTYGAVPSESPTDVIYLDTKKTAWLCINHLPANLSTHTRDNFVELFNLHPKERGVVIMPDASQDKNINYNCKRWMQSYGNTPKWNAELKTSYMFSGMNPTKQPDLPVEFATLLDFVNESLSQDKKYNQVVANWYEDSSDFIPYHSDYEYNATYNTGVAIVNMVAKEDVLRTFVLKAKSPDAFYSRVEIPLYHGRIIEMHGAAQKMYRHGVPKVPSKLYTPGPRISLSFRSFV